jgi:SAM-dependent methyltransferase
MSASFYEHDYASGGLTTNLPKDSEIQGLRDRAFRGSDKDFSQKIQVLKAVGLGPGSRVLDFGASWGYAACQMQGAGFDALGFEVSRDRAAFGSRHLGVHIETALESLQGPFDCMFSSHVVEHLPDPAEAFRLASRLLRPGGLFVAFTPNGCEERLRRNKRAYDHSWGRLHPTYLDDRFYRRCLGSRPWLVASRDYGQWRDLDEIAQWDRRSQRVLDLCHPELLLIWVNAGYLCDPRTL